MGYTASFDASCKVKAGDVKGYLNHFSRDVDKQNGCEVRHSNPNIHSDLTSQNMTYVYDASRGGHIKCSSSKQLEDALAVRLQSVKKPLRKDAIVLRPLILQLDPEWYRDNENADNNRIMQDLAGWAVKKFGIENVLGLSMHLDEGKPDVSPHMHVMFTPVTEDGRLSQKDFFQNPQAMSELHKDLRRYLNARGYDIAVQNQKPGKYAKRLSESEYRDYKALQQEAAHLDTRKQLLDERENSLNALESDLKVKEQELDAKSLKIDSDASENVRKAKELQEKESRLNQRERVVQADELQDKNINTTLRHPQRGHEFDF